MSAVEFRDAPRPDEAPSREARLDEERDVYLVWSNEHRAWWGPLERGYVKRVADAGRYSRGLALAICRNALGTAGHMGIFSELPVRLRDVEDFTKGQMVPGRLI